MLDGIEMLVIPIKKLNRLNKKLLNEVVASRVDALKQRLIFSTVVEKTLLERDAWFTNKRRHKKRFLCCLLTVKSKMMTAIKRGVALMNSNPCFNYSVC